MRPFRRNSRPKVSKAGAVLVALLTTGMGGGDVKINDLWIFVSRMSASLKTLSVRNLSDAPLPFKMIKNNEYINFYTTEDITLADGTNITAIDLRLSKERDGAAPFLSFSPSGRCITLDAVKKYYPHLELTDYPRGRSGNEVTSYTASKDKNGEKISFSFTVNKPDCLDSVVISAD